MQNNHNRWFQLPGIKELQKKPNYVYVAISLNFNKFVQLSSWEPITEKLSADSFSLNIQSNASKIKGAFSRLMAQCDNTEKEVLLSFSFTELYPYGNKMPTLKCSLFFLLFLYFLKMSHNLFCSRGGKGVRNNVQY